MQARLKILDIFYGNQCNLACEQCDTRSDIIRKKNLDPSIEEIKKGILLAKEKFDIEIYSLLGGEPLLYLEKVEEILKFIRSFDNDTIIMLPTNGDLISRNLDYLTRVLKEYKVLLMVSDHVRNFKDKTRSNNIKKSSETLSVNLNLSLINSNILWDEILNQRPNDQTWTQYWDTKALYHNGRPDLIDQNTSEDFLWWNGSYGIFLQGQSDHLKHYYLKDNKPKPFNSLDPDKSYFKSCPSCYCTFLLDNKLYKCAALGTLKTFLEKHESVDDYDWQKYLSYKPLDLETCSDDEVNIFSISKYHSISECSMCPENPQSILLNENTVLPIKFYKNETKN